MSRHHVYLAYTKSDHNSHGELMRVYKSTRRAFIWLLEIARRHDITVAVNPNGIVQVGPVGDNHQWWWLEEQELH